MKQSAWILMLVAILTLALVGCGDKPAEKDKAGEAAGSAPKACCGTDGKCCKPAADVEGHEGHDHAKEGVEIMKEVVETTDENGMEEIVKEVVETGQEDGMDAAIDKATEEAKKKALEEALKKATDSTGEKGADSLIDKAAEEAKKKALEEALKKAAGEKAAGAEELPEIPSLPE